MVCFCNCHVQRCGAPACRSASPMPWSSCTPCATTPRQSAAGGQPALQHITRCTTGAGLARLSLDVYPASLTSQPGMLVSAAAASPLSWQAQLIPLPSPTSMYMFCALPAVAALNCVCRHAQLLEYFGVLLVLTMTDYVDLTLAASAGCSFVLHCIQACAAAGVLWCAACPHYLTDYVDLTLAASAACSFVLHCIQACAAAGVLWSAAVRPARWQLRQQL
jgi:hypothetical protein